MDMELPKVRTAPRVAGGRNLLLSLTPGPVAEGDTSAGLDSYGWAYWVDPQGIIRHQRAGDAPLSPDAPTPSFMAGIDGRTLYRISAGFDQNARRVLALSTRDSVTVSYLIPGPVDVEQRVSFAGCDALVFWDGLMRDYRAGEPTDVGIYYLSPDRLSLRYRLQLESYAIERTLATLEQPCSLDAIARSGLRVVFYLGPKGSKTGLALVSENYPARARDALSLGVSLQSGVHYEVVVQRDLVNERLSLAVALQNGVLDEPMIQRDILTEQLSLSPTLQSGTNNIVVVQIDPVTERMSLSPVLQSGASAEVSVPAGIYTEGMSLGVILQGGSVV